MREQKVSECDYSMVCPGNAKKSARKSGFLWLRRELLYFYFSIQYQMIFLDFSHQYKQSEFLPHQRVDREQIIQPFHHYHIPLFVG